MSDTRLYAETRCEHGRLEPHTWGGPPIDPGWSQFPNQPNECPGGVRREVDLDSVVGEVGLRLLRYQRSGGTITPERVTTTLLNVVDAALGVSTEEDQ